MAGPPVAVLLLPARLERLAVREQVEALARASGVVAVEPGGLSHATVARLPEPLAERVVAGQARRLVRALRRRPAVVVAFDPLQWPLAQALLALAPGGELVLVVDEPPADPRPDVRERAARHAAEAATAAAATVAPEELAERLRPRLRDRGVALD